MSDPTTIDESDETPIDESAIPSRAPFPVDFALVDDNDQPHLRIDDGHISHAMVLRITNRSGRDMAFAPSRPDADFCHLMVTFRPGILSRRTREILTGGSAAQRALGPDAALWKILGLTTNEDGTETLRFEHIGENRVLAAGGQVYFRLLDITAAGASARPTRVELALGAVTWRGEAEPVPGTARHVHLYLLHGGRSALPLHIGFLGSSTIPVSTRPGTPLAEKQEFPAQLRVILRNLADRALGAGQKVPARLALAFDDDKHLPWALHYGETRNIQVPRPEVSAKIDDRSVDVHHVARDQGSSALRWEIVLPQEGLAPDADLIVTLDNVLSFEEGATNLYIESFDVAGYANSRTILSAERSRVSKPVLDALVAGIAARVRRTVMDEFGIPMERHVFQGLFEKHGEGPYDPRAEQKWRTLVGSGPKTEPVVAVSTKFILTHARGAVGQIAPTHSFFVGGVNSAQDEKDGSGNDYKPFVDIGEVDGNVVLLSHSGAVLVARPARDARWHYGGSAAALGTGWIADKSGDFSYPMEVRLSGGGLSHGFISGEEHDRKIVALGGTREMPLFVDAAGNVWWRSSGPHEYPEVWSLATTMKALDVNEHGVLIEKPAKEGENGRIWRYADGWHRLPGAGVRIGGTWRNPMTVNAAGELFVLQDPE